MVDSVEKFKEETRDKSEDIDVIPVYGMLGIITQAMEKIDEMRPGVYVTNVKVTVPVYGEEEV